MEHAVAPAPPRRLTSGQRASQQTAARSERIRRIGSGDRAVIANGGRSTIPMPARRRVPTSTTRG